jgi:TP901 family phage tail tape measure protein
MATVTSRLIVALTDRVSGPAKGAGAALMHLRRQGERTSGALLGTAGAFGGGLVRGALAVGASYYGMSKAIGGTVGAAIQFEEKFADVRKVVDGTPAQLAEVRQEIIDLSKRLPVTAAGIADIYAAAGQSGVALNELGKFSEMAAKVSVAWDTSQAETGDALAKIKTQLGLNVDDLGKYADAINYLSNNSASAAPDLVDYAKRVAAVGKIAGFGNTETLAFGSAMVSSGAESEVAATSFRNMAKALTIGERATKKQRVAFDKLGLDSVKTAKNMQKNALKTTLDVFDKIAALPEWQRISIASALFGDEARGLMPVIANTKELRRELGMVADEATYSGSAFQEYLVRSQTTANALQLIGNKIKAVGIGIGDSWLPTIKELGLGLSDILDTLDKRVGVLDQVKAAFTGFLSGVGYGGTGGVRQMIDDLGDLIFGKAFGGELSEADDRVIGLARLSNRFRGIGRDLKSFADNVSGANISAAMGDIGSAISKLGGGLSVGGAIAIGAVGGAVLMLGRGITAVALSKYGQMAAVAFAVAKLIDAAKGADSIGEFVDNLSKLSTFDWVVLAGGIGLAGAKVWQLARGLGLIRKAGGVAAAAGGARAVGAAAGVAGVSMTPAVAAALTAAGVAAGTGYVIRQLAKDNFTESQRLATHRDAERSSMAALRRDPNGVQDALDSRRSSSGGGFLSGLHALDDWLVAKFPSMRANTGGASEVNVVGVPEVSIPGPVTTQPSGTQDVRVTNPMPAPVINLTINAQTNDPHAIAAAAEAALSAKLNALSRGAFSDGAN